MLKPSPPVSENETLFGIFADIIKLKGKSLGWALIQYGQCPYKKREGVLMWRQTHKDMAIWPQRRRLKWWAKGWQQPPEARRGKGSFSPTGFRGSTVHWHLGLEFLTWDCETISFYCLKLPSVCTSLWQPSETNTNFQVLSREWKLEAMPSIPQISFEDLWRH